MTSYWRCLDCEQDVEFGISHPCVAKKIDALLKRDDNRGKSSSQILGDPDDAQAKVLE